MFSGLILITILLARTSLPARGIYRRILKHQNVKKSYQRLMEAPAFSHRLDCFVKFEGQVQTRNRAKTKFTNTDCAGHRSRVIVR